MLRRIQDLAARIINKLLRDLTFAFGDRKSTWRFEVASQTVVWLATSSDRRRGSGRGDRWVEVLRVGPTSLRKIRGVGQLLEKVGSVQSLVLLQHADVLSYAPGPRLRPLGVLDAVQDRIPVDAVKRGEELARFLIFIELPL